MSDDKCDFGESLDEMDVEAFLNIRDWLEKAITDKGAKVTDAGIGAGRADIGFTINGAPFRISIKPCPMSDVDGG